MKRFAFDQADIVRLLQSMTLAHARGAFLPGIDLTPEHMPDQNRHRTAKAAAVFFDLDKQREIRLAQLDSWPQWADLVLEHFDARARARAPQRFVFQTSGSTGTPCTWPFSPEDLAEECRSLLPFFQDRQRVVSVMPVHHVFGFAFALLLPKALNIPVKELPPLPTADFFQELNPGDMILAFPVFWRSFLNILKSAASPVCPACVYGVTSAAPCPPEVIEDLLALRDAENTQNLFINMTEIYGATEFGAVGIRRNCREPYRLLPHWQTDFLDNAEDEQRPAKGIRRASGALMPLPDEMQWWEGRAFTPIKRKDRAVQVGGVNVFPASVAELLRSHPDVEDCAVRLMRPEEGVRLKAFVVPKNMDRISPGNMIRELRSWLAERLEPAATPKSIRLGDSLPVTPSGKQADWNISEV